MRPDNARGARSACRERKDLRNLDPRSRKCPASAGLQHRLKEFRAAALRVEIFVAEDERPAMLDGALRGRPKRARMAEMEQAGGRWS